MVSSSGEGIHAQYNLDSLTGEYFGQEYIVNFDTIYSILVTTTGYHGWISGVIENGVEGPLGMAIGADTLVRHKLPYFQHHLGSGFDIASLTYKEIFVGCFADENLTHEISVVGSVTG